MMQSDIWENMNRYKIKKDNSIYWYNKSSDLRSSAAALSSVMGKENSDEIVKKYKFGEGFKMEVAIGNVFWMICGLSLELLYKAIIIEKGNKFKKVHELKYLAEEAGLKIDSYTEGILEILTESISWQGKYPIPKEKDKEKLVKFSILLNVHVFNKSSPGSQTKNSKNSIDWNSFNNIWLEANKIYCEHEKDCGE